MKTNCPHYLQMILEKRTTQGVLRLIQPEHGDCVSSTQRPHGKDEVEKCAVAVDGDKDREGKTQHEKTEETNHEPSHLAVTKPEPANEPAPPAVGKTSLLSSPCFGKLTYNPITHAPSMSELIIFLSQVSEFKTFLVLIKICS